MIEKIKSYIVKIVKNEFRRLLFKAIDKVYENKDYPINIKKENLKKDLWKTIENLL